MKRLTMILATLGFSAVSMAQQTTRVITTTTTTLTPALVNDDALLPTGHWLSVGMLGGGADYNRGGQDASLLGAMFDYSYFMPERSTVFSTGLSVDAYKPEGSSRFANVAADLSYLYRAANRLSIGPAVRSYIGDGDRMGSSDPTFTGFVGLSAGYDFVVQRSLLKIFANLYTDINVKNRNANLMLIGLKFGLGAKEEVITETHVTKRTADEASYPLMAEQPIESVQATELPEKTMAVEEDHELVGTDIGQAKASEYMSTTTTPVRELELKRTGSASIFTGDLDSLVTSLKANPFKKIVLTGQGDQKGSKRLNDMLATNRAREVRGYLMRQGIPSSQIEIREGDKALGSNTIRSRKVEAQILQ